MDRATEATVLGDFNDASFTHYGVTSTFFRRNGGFFVRTDGPGGRLTEYEIGYTFGVRPLQQYLIEFPDGRLQALGICWDTRPAEDGGQRWFHVYPDEPVPHDDLLHWTGLAQNWNYMCAECHSTNLRKGYDAEEDRFETTWSDIDVSCEACHGPGSRHVAWARKNQGAAPLSPESRGGDDLGLTVRLKDTDGGLWAMTESGNARRTVPREDREEIETCARCHSHRTKLSEDYVHGRPLLDTHRLALLADGLYHPDGQILEEVYVYGSFLQSRMYAEGVTCTDCHDAHTGRVIADGNALCAQCHLPTKYDAPSHHFHKPESPGAQCVECHMPETTYMVVDPRRDHSLRVPRPDLSARLGTPNACNRCHADQSVTWAMDAVAEWYGPDRRREPHWGEAIHAARTGQVDAAERLRRLAGEGAAPAIARATAVSLLPRVGRDGLAPALEEALQDPDPLVRAAAIDGLDSLDPASRLRLAYRHLDDPVRLVRTEAARVLASVPAGRMSPDQLARRDRVLEEYRQTQLLNTDRAEAHLNLGMLHLHQGEPGDAEGAFREAIRRMPGFVPAWINLADLLRELGRDEEGEEVLRTALKQVPSTEAAGVHHALGLLLVRRERLPEAVAELRIAAQLEPDVPRFPYVLAVALHSVGDAEAARRVLAEAHDRFPGHAETAAFLDQLGGAP
jgi:predicted CXXCH cytochrome family protein